VRAARTSGVVGPHLDRALRGRDAGFVRRAILHPETLHAPGYPNRLMPRYLRDDPHPRQLDQLVAFLVAAAR
jgi:hypothetical protein